jgi:hypothetical protein
MSDSSVFSLFYIILFIGVWTLVFQMISGKFDRKRIREHIESHGGKVINIERNFFGAGLFGGAQIALTMCVTERRAARESPPAANGHDEWCLLD